MVWKIIRRLPRIENARMRIYRNLHAWRFLCVFDVHLGVSRSREKLVHTFEQNCLKLTYAFQNLKRRSRPIVSGDFCRSPSFADPPRWADKKIDRRTSAPIGFKSACFLLCEYLVLFFRNGCGIVRAVPFGCCVVILQQYVHSCVLPALE